MKTSVIPDIWSVFAYMVTYMCIHLYTQKSIDSMRNTGRYCDTKTQAGHQARCCCVSGIEWCGVEVRNLESILTLL